MLVSKPNTDKTLGYKMLREAADLGHKEAKTELAWAHLLGHYINLDIPYAKSVFEEMAKSGIPGAHMVSWKVVYKFLSESFVIPFVARVM